MSKWGYENGMVEKKECGKGMVRMGIKIK